MAAPADRTEGSALRQRRSRRLKRPIKSITLETRAMSFQIETPARRLSVGRMILSEKSATFQALSSSGAFARGQWPAAPFNRAPGETSIEARGLRRALPRRVAGRG